MRLCRTGRTARGLAACALIVAAIASAVTLPAPAGGAPAPKLLGPVLSRAENPTTSLARDGGFSVPLPNGNDFWVFADTPRFEFRNNRWKIVSFITGSTAGMARFTPGRPLGNPLTEVRPGEALRSTNQPAQFMATPKAYLPDGSGRRCRSTQGGAFSVRWPTGAALMPDKTNVLVSYAIVCVLNVKEYTPQGWGFALFDYTKQKFSVGPTDVIRACRSGATMPPINVYGSPVVVGHDITFYSWTCCAPSTVYATTVDATVAALKRRASYVPTPMAGLPYTFNVHVAPRSKTHSKFTMYVLTGTKGEYMLYAASSPAGPWSQVGSGALPRCNISRVVCHSMALHPELSPAGRLVVSYHLPGFGPGVATKHPYPHEPLAHVVSASLPCNCS